MTVILRKIIQMEEGRGRQGCVALSKVKRPANRERCPWLSSRVSWLWAAGVESNHTMVYKSPFLSSFPSIIHLIFCLNIYLFGCALSWRQHAGSAIFLVTAREFLVTVYGIQVSDQGLNPGPLHWESGVSATGPPGKSTSTLLSSLSPLRLPSLRFSSPCARIISMPLSPTSHALGSC